MATVTKRRQQPVARQLKSASKNANLVTNPSNSAAGKAGKMIYYFSKSRTDGRGDMKPLLGGKGANLAAMTSIGLPVPPGFTITTEVCVHYYKNGKKYPSSLQGDIKSAVAWLEKETGKTFGEAKNQLLVSIRSGARDPMPVMMDTILNLGLNDKTVESLKTATGNGRFAWDSYRRFVQMYGDVVMGVQKRHENEHEPFDEVMDGLKHERGVK